MEKKKLKKEDLLNLAYIKVKKMTVSELKWFIGVNKPLDAVPEIFKIDVSFSVNSVNNTNGGRNSGGGELYKRAVVRIKNQELDIKELEISVEWFTPSGYGDENMETEPTQYILTDQDILGIKDHGARYYLEALFGIHYVLKHNTQIPYTLPKTK